MTEKKMREICTGVVFFSQQIYVNKYFVKILAYFLCSLNGYLWKKSSRNSKTFYLFKLIQFLKIVRKQIVKRTSLVRKFPNKIFDDDCEELGIPKKRKKQHFWYIAVINRCFIMQWISDKKQNRSVFVFDLSHTFQANKWK